MTFQATMRVHLFDLLEEGVETVLDRLQGQAGLTGIIVPLLIPTESVLRPHADVSPHRLTVRGGLQFQPNAERYAASRLRPVVAEWLRKRDPLAEVLETCERRGLSVEGEIICCVNDVLAERHPGCAVKDVFGEQDDRRLCPANLDTREFLCGLVEDAMDGRGLTALRLLELRYPELPPSSRGFFPVLSGTSDVIPRLQAMCFCESCRQLAARDGVNVNRAAAGVRSELERAFESGEAPEADWETYIRHAGAVAEYVAWQANQAPSLLPRLREACRCPKLLMRNGGDDLSGVRSHLSGVIEPLGIGAGVRTAGLPVAGELDVNEKPDSAALVRETSQAVENGVTRVNFGDYRVTPLGRLDWIKQAVRKAQRDLA